MSKSLLSLLPAGLVTDRVTITPDQVLIAVRARARTAACPLCHRRSRRVHSRYVRHLGDLPWQGRLSRFDLQVRRFRCSDPECPRRVFAERLPAVALPRVRRTVRLADAQRRIALSTGGEGGARLARALAMPVSGDTMLRLIRASPLLEAPSPRVVGIDDWAKLAKVPAAQPLESQRRDGAAASDTARWSWISSAPALLTFCLTVTPTSSLPGSGVTPALPWSRVTVPVLTPTVSGLGRPMRSRSPTDGV